MPMVPPFMLKKIYVPQSLKNTEDGFTFQLKNNLAPGTITAFKPVLVDGQPCDPDKTFATKGTESVAVSQISASHTLTFALNVITSIVVKGAPLSPGQHTITLDVMTREAGQLKWDFTDTVA